MIMTGDRRVAKAFTLIELLVVIAIVGILAGLLMPAVAFGKFQARVRTCANNYRQFTLAAAMYAGDDSKGRLPAFELPTESSQLVGFRNLYPWLIGLPMLRAMETHGIVQPQMWYCPLRNSWQQSSTTFQAVLRRPLATIDDFSKYFTDIQKSKYAFADLNWWVPRRLEGSPTLTYPDASLLPTRLKAPWPSKLDDLTISTRPIVSDWMIGSKDPTGDVFTTGSGAHAFAGKVRNANSGYADGHVQAHSAGSMKWELQLTGVENSYIFY
jgi:prepilin-type N-terminal cleavage/methylation domain-containing protein/prepilin-type processing-associated H-X9-DG protein